MIKLMIDAMGGDNAPQAIVEGCVAALKDMKDLHLTLFGRKEEIEAILKDMEYEKDRLDIVDAREIVDNNEAPVMAVRRKKDSTARLGGRPRRWICQRRQHRRCACGRYADCKAHSRHIASSIGAGIADQSRQGNAVDRLRGERRL